MSNLNALCLRIHFMLLNIHLDAFKLIVTFTFHEEVSNFFVSKWEGNKLQSSSMSWMSGSNTDLQYI